MSTLKTNAIQSTGGKPLLHSTGSILQVVSTYKGDHFQTNSTSWTDITGMSCSITPSNSGNKILVWACFGGCSTRQSNMDHGHGISDEMFSNIPDNKFTFLKTHTHYSKNYENIAIKKNTLLTISRNEG